MHKLSNKLSLLVTAIACTPLLMGAYGLNPAAVGQVAAREGANLSTKIGERIGKSQNAITTAIRDNTSLIQEGIAINIQQEAVAAAQIAKADMSNRQIKVAVQEQVMAADKKLEILQDYGPATGQGYAACKVYAESKQTNQAIGEAQLKTTVKVQDTDNAPGKMPDTVKSYRDKRQAVHNENFCTQEEVDRKLCRATGPLPGGDSNSALLFESAKPGSLVAAAKDSVRQNIVGNPHVAIPKWMGRTAAGQAYLLATNRATALSAFPAYSLAFIQSMTEVREDLKDAKGNPLSPQQMLINSVSRYYGTDEATEWRKSMIEQRPRGILVELAKMEGLGAYLDYQKSLANQRIGGNLAALVLTGSLPLEEQMLEQRRRLARNSVSGMIGQ